MAEKQVTIFLTRQQTETIAYILHIYQEQLRPDDENSPSRKQAVALGNFIAEQLNQPE